VPGGRLLRHRAVVDGDGLPGKSTSVLDLGGEEDDFEEREGLEEMARFGGLLEEAEIAGCCAGWDWSGLGEWLAVGEPSMG